MRRSPLAVFGLALGGLLLLQAAWALVVPPFTGLDEYSHAFKAASVARGEWRPPTAHATGGDGLVAVPDTLVTAAKPVCDAFVYSTNDHCRVHAGNHPGLVEVGSSAATYNPVFYAVVGAAGRPFTGAASLYAMRIAASLLCGLVLATGIAVGMSWSTSSLQAAGMWLTLTPVTIYTTMVVAPNGIELASAFLTWIALLGATRTPADDPRIHRYVQIAALAAVPLALVRALGPLWLALIVLTCAALCNRAQLRSILRCGRTWLAAVPTVAAVAAGVVWTLSTSLGGFHASVTTSAGGTSAWPSVWGQLPKEYLFWFLQTLGTFPSRVEFAPLALYATLVIALWVLVSMAWRHSRRRERLTLVAIWALSSAIPIAATVKSYAASGPLWQGRYGYPYAMGFVLLCGLVLDRASSGQLQRSRAILAATGVVVGAAELIGLLHVLRHERAVSPLSGSSEWITPSTTLVVLLVAGAAGLMVLAGLDGNRRTPAAGAERSTSRLVVASTAATSQPVVVRPDRESP